MNKDKTNALAAKYPIIFQDLWGPRDQTCMHYGITTGDGWYEIIDNLCAEIMEFYPQGVKAFQIKEKFGTLSFYFEKPEDMSSADWSHIYKLISDASIISSAVCEQCGSYGKKQYITDFRIGVVCDSCANELRRLED